MDTSNFYRDLPSFRDFARCFEFDAYVPVPGDWVVVMSDVRGSTQAIHDGRYKDVNMVGAATITAVLNACPGTEIPFVFGGDGATLVVPGKFREAADGALLGLQSVSEETFGLTLRVGSITVEELRRLGSDLLVRKLQLSPGNYLAMFAGSGLEAAEAALKSGLATQLHRADAGHRAPDLGGLSCRWEPLKPKGGLMAAIMVQPIGDLEGDARARLLAGVLEELADILGSNVEQAAPVSDHALRFRWPPRGLKLEARATAGGRRLRRYLEVLASSLAQKWAERFRAKVGPYDAPAYREELKTNTDFRKFDGTLRMVLDLDSDKYERLGHYLDREYRARRLVYGMHAADSALMTCLVFSLEQSEHVHFVDCADGGFAMAASEFKARLKEVSDGRSAAPPSGGA